MALPAGFELEQAPVMKLPPGFQLEGGNSPGDYQSVIQGENLPASGFLSNLGRGAASLADTTAGSLLPMAAQQIVYPFARAVGTPEEAQATTRRVVAGLEQPFGKAFGVTGTPEYQQESSRKLLNFIGENFQKGANWLAKKTGLPVSDVENMLGSVTVAAPSIAGAATRAVAPVASNLAVGPRLLLEKALQGRREKASLDAYAKGPQLDAVKEAQRLGIALNPVDIQPSTGTRLTSAIAGEKGSIAIEKANKDNVRRVVLNELDLPLTTQLDKGAAFEAARSKLAGPYEEIGKLPTIVADDAARASLEQLRPGEHLIGSDTYARSMNKIIDSALDKTSGGLSGAELLDNISTLRKRAKKVYNSKTADLAALDIADTNLAVANALEGMIESNVKNPKTLEQFRDARKKMARSYAYEGATDFNTGVVDVSKLARITAKDNAMTGDIASLGKIAGNFPDAFTTQVASNWQRAQSIGRTGVTGTLGGMAGYGLGGNYLGAAIGSLAGAVAGKVGENFAARRVASPGYQAGLTLKDARIPVNQLAASMQPIPQDRSVVPYTPEVFGPGPEGVNSLRIVSYDANGVPIYAADGSGQGFTMPGTPNFGAAPTPYAQRSLPNEVPKQIYQAQKNAELAQEFQARAERKPTGTGSILEFDPISGKMTVGAEGGRGVTPNIQVLESTGKSGISASAKVQAGMPFNLTATEKVALRQSLLEGMKTEAGAPALSALTDKAIANKMMDRQWISDTVAKLRQQDEMFNALAAREMDKLRAGDKAFKGLEAQMAWQRKVEAAAAERASLLAKLESLEQSFNTGAVNRLAPNVKNSLINQRN